MCCCLQNQTPGFSVRLHLKAGRDVQDMYVFRNVAILGLTSNYNGSIAYQVRLQPAMMARNLTESSWCPAIGWQEPSCNHTFHHISMQPLSQN